MNKKLLGRFESEMEAKIVQAKLDSEGLHSWIEDQHPSYYCFFCSSVTN